MKGSAFQIAIEQAEEQSKRARELTEIGEYKEAVEALTQAISFRKQAYGETHPQLADDYTELGMLHYNQGSANYIDARASLELALEVMQKVYGMESSEVALGFERLANIHKVLNDYIGAATNLQSGIKIWEVLEEKGKLPASVNDDAISRKLEDLSALYLVAGMAEEQDRVIRNLDSRKK